MPSATTAFQGPFATLSYENTLTLSLLHNAKSNESSQSSPFLSCDGALALVFAFGLGDITPALLSSSSPYLLDFLILPHRKFCCSAKSFS